MSKPVVIRDPSLAPFEIEVGPRTFTLIEVSKVARGVDEGKELREFCGEHPEIETCVDKIIRRRVLDEQTVFTLEEFITTWKHYNDKVVEALKMFKKTADA